MEDNIIDKILTFIVQIIIFLLLWALMFIACALFFVIVLGIMALILGLGFDLSLMDLSVWQFALWGNVVFSFIMVLHVIIFW